jgi:osmoprotectant transport system substrate-binding protein
MIVRLSRRAFVATGAAAALSTAVRAADAPVIVGSKLDVEGGIIGAMILQTLSTAGIATVNRLLLGPTAILRQAILAGAVDVYPEYTGNAAFFFNRDGEAVWKDAAAGYRLAAELDKARNDLIWLPPAPADNTWVIAVSRAVAHAHRLETLVDFARWAGQGGVKLAASAEFVESAAGLPAFESTYGFRLNAGALLVLSGGDTSATIKAAASNISGVNAAMAYSTDGALAALDMVALVDAKHAQPVYAPAAVIRGPVLERQPAIVDLMRPVFAGLDLATLRRLNEQVAVDGENAQAVAAGYLSRKSG